MLFAGGLRLRLMVVNYQILWDQSSDPGTAGKNPLRPRPFFFFELFTTVHRLKRAVADGGR